MELGVVERINYPAFTVIGKVGEGLAEDGASWVPPLWQLTNEHFDELGDVVPVAEMTELHLWGLMSDTSSWLAPWQEVGRYLAGLEVPSDTPTPADWTRWEMPAMEYLTVKTNAEELGATMEKVFNEVMAVEGLQLVAAVQEYYEADFGPGEVVLYFPIAMN